MAEPVKLVPQPDPTVLQTRQITVIYIAGCGRSGSTLMMRLLAKHAEGVAVGELFHLWNNGYKRNFVCGCGVRFSECPFWTAVTRKAFGCDQADVDAERMRRLQQRVHGPQALLPLRFRFLRSRAYRRELEEYTEILSRLYTAIAETANTDVVVDSSKSPQLARMLCALRNARVHVVHLVRDSRATAWSWKRVRTEPALGDTAATMRRFPAWRSALEWTLSHAILLFDRKKPASYTVCKYEEFVENPGGELRRVVPWLASDGNDSVSEAYELAASHSVTGNPNRFESGPVSITLDAEWQTAMSGRDRWIVTAISGPLLKWFRYPLRTKRR